MALSCCGITPAPVPVMGPTTQITGGNVALGSATPALQVTTQYQTLGYVGTQKSGYTAPALFSTTRKPCPLCLIILAVAAYYLLKDGRK